MRDAVPKGDVQKWLAGLFSDPILKILLKSSQLTRTQLETFLIDVLAERVSGKALVYERKAKLRLMKSGVSRGAFNRTLAQARRNIIESVYTIILLGYIGIFDSPCLDPYVEIANRIRTYSDACRDMRNNRTASAEHLRIISMLQKEIERGLQQLSGPRRRPKRT